uniref:Uncharacterized protein n=1 Tax=Cercocebus atys TaxID=9531 RepID=A0A2K5NFV6_CERAT
MRHGRGPTKDRVTYEWRLWTPPSTWAEDVLFSNLSSPEYIMALKRGRGQMWVAGPGPAPLPMSQLPKLTGLGSSSWHQCPGMSVGCQQSGACPWHQENPYRDISLAGSHRKRSTHQGPQSWQPGESPS